MRESGDGGGLITRSLAVRVRARSWGRIGFDARKLEAGDLPYRDPQAQREYQRRWVAARRAAWLGSKTCRNCGATEDLEVHHRDPGQKLDHKVWTWSAERRDAELAKCEVLCERCHVEHHRAGRHSWRRGCRCGDCRAAHADQNRRWLQRRAERAAA